jgi:hypothetical protein
VRVLPAAGAAVVASQPLAAASAAAVVEEAACLDQEQDQTEAERLPDQDQMKADCFPDLGQTEPDRLLGEDQALAPMPLPHPRFSRVDGPGSSYPSSLLWH